MDEVDVAQDMTGRAQLVLWLAGTGRCGCAVVAMVIYMMFFFLLGFDLYRPPSCCSENDDVGLVHCVQWNWACHFGLCQFDLSLGFCPEEAILQSH